MMDTEKTCNSQSKASFISAGGREPGMEAKAGWDQGTLSTCFQGRKLIKCVCNCGSYLLLYKKLCLKFTSFWQQTAISLCFCGSGIQEWLAERFWLRASWDCVKRLARAAVIRGNGTPQVLHGCRPETSVPHPLGLSLV